MIALFYCEENWRGKRTELAYRRALEAKGRSLDYRRFVPPSVPNNENFANTPFFAPLFDFKPGTQIARDTNAWQRTTDFAKDFPESALKTGWQMGRRIDLAASALALEKSRSGRDSQTDFSATNAMSKAEATVAILDGLKKYDAVLNELRASSAKPYCRFNIYYELDDPAEILVPHLAKIKRVCQIVGLRALAELEFGKTQAAADDVALVFYLMDSVKNEPLLISQLVRIACLQLGMQVIWEGTHFWTDSQLEQLQKRFRELDLMRDLSFSIEAERASGNRTIGWLKSSSRGGYYFTALANLLDDTYPFSYFFQLCPRGWFDFEKCNYNRVIEERVIPCFSEEPRRIYPAVMARNSEWLHQSVMCLSGVRIRHTVLSSMLLFPIDSVIRKFAVAQTSVDLASVACALERYRLSNGRYPEKLAELVPSFLASIPEDIVSGAPLTFHQEGSHLILYSVGWNEKDDGGTVVLTKEKPLAADFTQGDWVWQLPEK